MSKSKPGKDKILSPKKELRHKITGRLLGTLTDLEEKLGKKEFESRIKKAVKLLTAGIKVKVAKPPKAKPGKKDQPVSEPKAE
jgi:hypothetical protein